MKQKLLALLAWANDRLHERSSWAGIGAIAASVYFWVFHQHLSPEDIQSFEYLVVGGIALLAFLFPEKNSGNVPTNDSDPKK